MCGIFAVASQRNEVNIQRAELALQALNHRGPDGQSLWVAPDRKTLLGHVRLAIIGVNNGTQPIANERGDIHIVVNGEFYDFERIRAELQSKGHEFKTASDSEIALHLYEEYGVGCLEHLRGEFAFVIFDSRLNRVFAARDRFGIKPLVYTQVDDELYLASEAKALFAAGVKASWDAESFFSAANLQYVLPDRTLFRGVKQLRPGEYLISSNGNLVTQTYWDLDYACETAGDSAWAGGSDSARAGSGAGAGTSASASALTTGAGASVSASGSARTAGAGGTNGINEPEAIEKFRYLFDESVRLRLRADTPVCCHLSGGLDSSAVLGIAAQYSSAPVQCFTVSFEEASYDEFDIATEMAKFAGAELHQVKVSQSDLIEYLPDAVYFSEGFAVNGHLAAKYILNKEIRRAGYKVALTGEGSDEVVAGYPHLRSDLFNATGRGDLVSALHSNNRASAGIMLKHGETLPLHAVQQKLGYIPAFLEAKGSLGHKLRSVLDDEYVAAHATTDCYSALIDSVDLDGQMRGRNRVNQSLYLWTKTALANYILRTLGDGMEMSHSVEGRLPFLDHHLFEYVRNLPIELKIKDSIEKFVLREAVKPRITETIYSRRKHPFVAPPVSAFCTPASTAQLNDMLRSDSFKSVPFFDHNKMIALLDRLPQMAEGERAAYDPVLMTALSASALQSRFMLGS